MPCYRVGNKPSAAPFAFRYVRPMSVKEKPLFKAVEKTGPLPLPGHPTVAGFFSAFLCFFFAAVAMCFHAAVYAAGDGLQILNATLTGGVFGLLVAFLLYLGIGISALFDRGSGSSASNSFSAV